MNQKDNKEKKPAQPASPLTETPTGTHEFRSKWVGGWITPIIVILFTIFWCLGMYWLIPDRIRDWQYGVAPYVPGQSFLSTRKFTGQRPVNQVEYPSTVRRLPNGR